MGIRQVDSRLIVQFHEADGRPDGAPLFGAHAIVHGAPRSKVLEATGELRVHERNHSGSEDWLTFVAVADSRERLDAILQSSNPIKGDMHTSCSSHRVLVEVHVGDVRRTVPDAVTIASGPVVRLPSCTDESVQPIVDIVHVRVLPAGTDVEKIEPHLLEEFDGGVPLLLR